MQYMYFVGFAWAECTQLFQEGFLAYVKSWYNLMDIALLCVYCASFTLRYVIMFKVFLYGCISLSGCTFTIC